MDALKITLLSGVRLCRDELPLPAFPTRKVASLFACLVAYRQRPHALHGAGSRLLERSPPGPGPP